MIDPKELRIGNLVADGDVGFMAIESIDIQPMIQDGRNNYLYQPLQITPEWLQRFGFTEDLSNNPYEYKYTLVILNYNEFGDGKYYHIRRNKREDDASYHFFFDGVYVLPCKYVHQLQNAFYCLEGMELTIKNND